MEVLKQRWSCLPSSNYSQDGSAACLISGVLLYSFGGYPIGNLESAIQLLELKKLEQRWKTLYCVGACSFYDNSFQSIGLLGSDKAVVFGSYDSSE